MLGLSHAATKLRNYIKALIFMHVKKVNFRNQFLFRKSNRVDNYKFRRIPEYYLIYSEIF